MENIKCCLLILLAFNLVARNSLGLSPVIFIPGDGGSQLEAKINKTSVVHYICAKTSGDYYNIWLNLELLVPFVIDCWVDNLKLDYDNITRTTKDPPGVEIRIPGWGNPEPVEWLDPSHDSAGSYFNTIGDALVKIGYVRNISLRGAPYDFRRAPNENGEFFVKLKTLVEETYNMNNKSAVTLLVHSMGGSMGLHFLRLQSQGWKDQYIRRMISLSTPWGGAVKALKVFAIGDDLGSLMLSQSTMRTEQITCPSLAWLLPSPNFWKPSEVLVQTDKFNYTIKDMQKLFTDMEVPNAWEMRKDTEKYSQDFSAPGVELHCLYGYNISTVEKLVYKPGTWLDGTPTLATGDGDGTVNLRSLSACEKWAKPYHPHFSNSPDLPVSPDLSISPDLPDTPKHPDKSYYYYKYTNENDINNNYSKKYKYTLNGRQIKTLPLKNAEHLKILHDQRVIDYITTVLKND